jgi:ligand-binding sensor domain-containing protein
MNIGAAILLTRWVCALSVSCICLTVMFATPGFAQYRFDSWTADNGLPQNSVYSILQTSDGDRLKSL